LTCRFAVKLSFPFPPIPSKLIDDVLTNRQSATPSIRFAYSRCEHLKENSTGTGGIGKEDKICRMNIRTFGVYMASPLHKVNKIRQYFGGVIAERKKTVPALPIQTSPINLAGMGGNGNRFSTQKLHVQSVNNLRSPQCQTKVQLLFPS
jgi:hypothetical protein